MMVIEKKAVMSVTRNLMYTPGPFDAQQYEKNVREAMEQFGDVVTEVTVEADPISDSEFKARIGVKLASVPGFIFTKLDAYRCYDYITISTITC